MYLSNAARPKCKFSCRHFYYEAYVYAYALQALFNTIPFLNNEMFAEDGLTGFLASVVLLAHKMTLTVHKCAINCMKLFVCESGNCRKAAEQQVRTRQRRSITRIRNLFLRSLTAATIHPQPPGATIDRAAGFATPRGPSTEYEDVPSAL